MPSRPGQLRRKGCVTRCPIFFRHKSAPALCPVFVEKGMSLRSKKSPVFFAAQASLDGAGIFGCLAGPISHFQGKGYVSSCMAASGTTAHAVESARIQGRNTGPRKFRSIGDVIGEFRKNFDDGVIRSLSFGNVLSGANIPGPRFYDCFGC